jgi:hypothetical protein
MVSLWIDCFRVLSNNELSSLPAGVFEKLTNLLEL